MLLISRDALRLMLQMERGGHLSSLMWPEQRIRLLCSRRRVPKQQWDVALRRQLGSSAVQFTALVGWLSCKYNAAFAVGSVGA